MKHSKRFVKSKTVKEDVPMSELFLANHLFPTLLNGTRTNTVRSKHRNIPLGPLTIKPVEPGYEAVEVQVVRVDHILLKDIPLDTVRANGSDTHDALLHDMRGFYPDMTFESPVTVVHFELHCA